MKFFQHDSLLVSMKCGWWSQYWRQKLYQKQLRWKTILTTKYSGNKKRLAANMFGNKQLWRQTVSTTNNFDNRQLCWQTILVTDNFDDKQFCWQTIMVTNNHHLSLLDSSSKCLLSFISLFNNGETVFICFGNAFTVNRFFSQAYSRSKTSFSTGRL